MSLDLRQVLGSVIVIVKVVLRNMLIHFAQKSNSAQSVHSDASVSMGTQPLRKSLQNTHFLENTHGMLYGPFCLGMCTRSSWSLPIADRVSGDCKFLEHRPVNLD